jgi:hypothetical protein
MKRRNLRKLAAYVAATSISFICARSGVADLATLEFEVDTLNLDAGAIIAQDPAEIDGTEGADVRVAYNADRFTHSVVVLAGETSSMAFLAGTSYESVTAADMPSLSFSTDVVNQPLEAYDTVVVKTDSGAVFKLGNAIEEETAVTIDYAQLQ